MRKEVRERAKRGGYREIERKTYIERGCDRERERRRKGEIERERARERGERRRSKTADPRDPQACCLAPSTLSFLSRQQTLETCRLLVYEAFSC